jgi:16S rRNA G966 N2-methylase RsmD
MMRVIGGQWKGRPIATPDGRDTRPTLGRVRQVLFDLLGQRLDGEVFLDLFAGSGAVGIEALSRGAARAVFVENDRRALAALERNIRELDAGDRATILRVDALASVDQINQSGPFDTIFLDPPYVGKPAHRTPTSGRGLAVRGDSPPFVPLARFAPLLAALRAANPEAALILQASARAPLPPGWSVARRRDMGETTLSWIARSDPPSSPAD